MKAETSSSKLQKCE